MESERADALPASEDYRCVVASKRQLLALGAGALAGVGVGGLPGCTPGSNALGLTQQAIDAIQAAVGQACSFIPNVAMLLGVLKMFPAIGNVVDIPAAVFTEVTNFICSSFKKAGGRETALSDDKGKMKMMVKEKDAATETEVPIHGYVWDPKTNQFVAF